VCKTPGFSEPIPRKGTETLLTAKPKETWLHSLFFRTYSPQGDGNHYHHLSFFCSLILLFFRTYSPQGDGNNPALQRAGFFCPFNVFQNLFPARGRKLAVLASKSSLNPAQQSFSEPIPRKGTETEGLTPAQQERLDWRFSEPIPRKGTETLKNSL